MFKEKDIITVKSSNGFDIFTIYYIQGKDIFIKNEQEDEFCIQEEDILSVIGQVK